MPRSYSAVWACERCEKESKLEWNLTVTGWLSRKKPPKLRKRKKERKQKTEDDVGTKKDRAYVNNHGNH